MIHGISHLVLQTVLPLSLIHIFNRFAADTQAEIQKVMEYCEKKGAQAVLSECWEKGGEGALDLARAVVELCETGDGVPHYTYPDDLPLIEKIQAVATRIYGADDVEFSDAARSQLAELTRLGMGDWPGCIAKTQMSLSCLLYTSPSAL